MKLPADSLVKWYIALLDWMLYIRRGAHQERPYNLCVSHTFENRYSVCLIAKALNERGNTGDTNCSWASLHSLVIALAPCCAT